MIHERNWETGEGFTNGLSARDIEYLIGVVTDTDYAAYRRGREDAAKAVNMLAASWKVDENGWQTLGDCMECGGTYDAYNLAIDDAYAAARGDGEQA